MQRYIPVLIGALATFGLGLTMPADAHPGPGAAAQRSPSGNHAPSAHFPRDEQWNLHSDVRSGKVYPQKVIERRILPTMRGMQYLGPQYDPVAMVYRLKFIHDGRVEFVDVDARNGQVRGRSR